MPDVLTLEEVAAYLRLPPELVLNQAVKGSLPSRKVEGNWRFLKTAIDDWLRAQDSRTVLLQQAGALADDESLDLLRNDIYRERNRSEIETV